MSKMSARPAWLAGVFSVAAAAIISVFAFLPALATGPEGITNFTGTTSGSVVYSQNNGNGGGVEGVTGAVANGQAVYGLANNAANAAFGVHGKVFGPASTGLYGEAVNTNTGMPSIGIFGYSKSGNGIYAYSTTATAAAAYIKNVAAGNGVGLQAQSGGNTIIGTSTNVNGVVGVTQHVGASLIEATAGVIGEDTGSYNFGVVGTSSNGFGVLGSSQTGIGVLGQSPNDFGVYGFSTNTHGIEGVTGNSIASNGSAGVIGLDESTSGVTDVGVEGVSTNGNGVVGMTSAGVGPNNVAGVLGQDGATGCCNYGVRGDSPHGFGVYGLSTDRQGVYGSSVGGYGVYGNSSRSAGVTAQSFATPYPSPNPNADGPPALLVAAQGGAPAIKVLGASNTHLMSLDGQGNLRIAGNLYANSSTVGTPGSPLVVHRMPSGQAYGTYSTQQAVASLDDIGEARLVNGYAYVRIDPAFTAAIDRRSSYLVFVTPQADTQGWLYATQKSAAGFVVREHGGHSNIAFDYRIVAKPLDADNRRLPVMNAQPPVRTFVPTNHTGGFLAPLIRPAAFSRNVPGSAASAHPRQAIDPRMLRLLRPNRGYIPKPPTLPPMLQKQLTR